MNGGAVSTADCGEKTGKTEISCMRHAYRLNGCLRSNLISRIAARVCLYKVSGSVVQDLVMPRSCLSINLEPYKMR